MTAIEVTETMAEDLDALALYAERGWEDFLAQAQAGDYTPAEEARAAAQFARAQAALDTLRRQAEPQAPTEPAPLDQHAIEAAAREYASYCADPDKREMLAMALEEWRGDDIDLPAAMDLCEALSSYVPIEANPGIVGTFGAIAKALTESDE